MAGVSGKIWIYQIHAETESLFLLNHVGGGEMYFQKEDTQEEPCNHKGGLLQLCSPAECDDTAKAA